MQFMASPAGAARPPIPILAYHQIGRRPARGLPYRGLVVAPATFSRQMRLLRALGWQGLSMGQLEPYLRGEKHGKVVGITFDDGYANAYHHALPVLHGLGFSATIYVVSGQLGGTNVWDRPLGYPAEPLMDAQQLRAWVASGQEVGAHTRNHVDLRRVDAARAREEILRCRHDLEQVLRLPVRHFCYPYGRYRPEHVAMAREAGYATATTNHGGRSRAGDALLELPRVVARSVLTLTLLWAHWQRDGLPGLSARPVPAAARPAAAPTHAAPAGSARPR
ncbi:MAG TPA: polysaccharide deacetylase family protein [Ramlibacter sp.]|nr:polysaccharide deacetylase family protein [Ramlibacter sp.]